MKKDAQDARGKHKRAAVEFLKLVVEGRIEEAYRKHVDMTGKHHNPFFPAGLLSLQKAMMENQVQSPNKQIIVKNVLGDRNLVAVHSHLVPKPADVGMTTVHLFRFRRGKIVEFWDCAQVVPADSPNSDGAF
jgi:predicted SnoaL-like aldol condensation-catalyzing enzyme